MSTTDEHDAPAPDPATWDPQAWLDGATSVVRTVVLHPRGDLVAQLEEIDRLIRISRDVGDADRALGDESDASLWARREDIAREFTEGAVTFHVEGRSTKRRDAVTAAVEKAAKKAGEAKPDDAELELHLVADGVIAPTGITVDFLRRLRDDINEQEYFALRNTYMAAVSSRPAVTVPSSGPGSSARRRPSSS